MGSRERPAKSYFKKMYENDIYEVHFKELKGTLVASSSDLWDLMEGFANEKTKQQREVIERLANLIQQMKEGYLSDDKERRLSLDITNAVLFLEAESLLKEID